MTEIDKIKSKIKKLFALSKSSNANEAAIALEMAQKLMMEHGIKRNDVGEFEIIEDSFKGNGGEKPPSYEIYLTSQISKSFGCKSAYGFNKSKKEDDFYYWGHTYVGLEHRVQIACFIAEVLLRKLRKARNEYIRKLSRVRTRMNKIKRADDFCFGWVYTVADKLQQFTNTSEEQKAIDNYVANLKWSDDLKTISRGSVKNSSINDYLNGRKAGQGVQIQHGVEGQESGALLLEAVV